MSNLLKEYTYYFVYRTTNTTNGKFYIGAHYTNNLEDGYIGSGVELIKDISLIGKKFFIREILCFCNNIGELKISEKNWIIKTKAKIIGYNKHESSAGGYISEEEYKKSKILSKDYVRSPEHIAKLIASRKRNGTNAHTQESKAKIASTFLKTLSEHPELRKLFSNKGDKNGFYKKSHSEETKKLIALKRSKGEVVRIDIKTGEILHTYSSCEETIRETNSSTPSAICNGSRKNKEFLNSYWCYKSKLTENEIILNKLQRNINEI